MTREEAIKNIKEHCYFANLLPQAKEALDMAISVLSENKEEPTDEEVIEYCNKRGYVICTQAFIDDLLKGEQHRIQFKGYVGVDEVVGTHHTRKVVKNDKRKSNRMSQLSE